MRTNQVTIGFEVGVTTGTIAKILKEYFGCTVDIGLGVPENGLKHGCLYVHNGTTTTKKEKTK